MNGLPQGIIFFSAALLMNCGGGGDSGENQIPTENNSGGSPNNNTSTTCNVSPPVCTLSVSPNSSSTNRLSSGTHFYFVANCNTSIAAAEWFEGKEKVLTGRLDLNAYPTVEAGYTLDIPYQINYSNCAGNGSAKQLVYINGGSAAGDGGNASGGSGGSTSGSSPVYECLSVTRNSNNIAIGKNICNKKISISWCTDAVGKDWDYSCTAVVHKSSPSGYIYGRGADEINPGGSKTLSGTQNVNVSVAVCFYPDFAFISSISKGFFSSYCN